MARSKDTATVRHTSSETRKHVNGVVMHAVEKQLEEQADAHARNSQEAQEAGLVQLLVCVAGIYMSFMTWAHIQERLTTTTHGPNHQRFTYSIFLNTVQSAFAALSGSLYLVLSAPKRPSGERRVPPIFPSQKILLPLLLIAVTSSLASPFGYASLKHIDYVTFILAKSCKLLPVMFLHISLFQKRYPLHKYMVIGCVTLGVAIFTLHNPSTAKKAAKKGVDAADASKTLGLFLLGVNLLFDGLTNTVQDNIFSTFKGFTGPQMMCAQNIISTALTVSFLLTSPYMVNTSLGSWVGLSPQGGGGGGGGGELKEALTFVTSYPSVGWDVVGFAACGAIGQVFIFHTLARFSSLLLVTVTVTRKMLTMVWSVWWYGHEITGLQWLGVALVFGGIGAEAAFGKKKKKKTTTTTTTEESKNRAALAERDEKEQRKKE